MKVGDGPQWVSAVPEVEEDADQVDQAPVTQPKPPEKPTPVWLVDGDFEALPTSDTGKADKKCVLEAPLGPESWGFHAETFARVGKDNPGHTLKTSQFAVTEVEDPSNPGKRTKVLRILGEERRGTTMGYATVKQGDEWNGTHCGPAIWRKPAPLPTYGKRLVLKVDVKKNEDKFYSSRLSHLYVGADSHVMMAFNVWLRSPNMPKGPDGKPKKFVMDLAESHHCNWGLGPCKPNPNDGGDVIHYIVRIGPDTPKDQWERWTINLSEHIEKAIEMFHLSDDVRRTLEIGQVEMLIEVMNAVGSMDVDNIQLVELPQDWPAVHDSYERLPLTQPDPVPVDGAAAHSQKK